MSDAEDTTKDAQIAGLQRELRDARRECEILQGVTTSRFMGGALKHPGPGGSAHRLAYLEHAVEKLDDFAAEFAQFDCDGYHEEVPCPCSHCRALRVRAEVRDWRHGGSRTEPSRRFVGALYGRVTNGWNPREAKIHAAWAKQVPDDYTLGQILSDDTTGGTFGRKTDWPSARDWYVATSIVQWLATNVGMSILEAAGFKYTLWDEDRKSLDEKRATP